LDLFGVLWNYDLAVDGLMAAWSAGLLFVFNAIDRRTLNDAPPEIRD
jgi:hypothetical protein